MENHSPTDQINQSLTKGQKKMVYILIAIVAVYYFWGWHKDHVLQYWPFAIFLLCPLMHMFHGHGGLDAKNQQ
jgi:hypothetical protein